ncbi:MAG: ATP-binding cassette domain-containing protein [Streptosporangiales bacterium]|nr:ATP-binding cassette domain-containing protein [Streptosporangiales bacterium]
METKVRNLTVKFGGHVAVNDLSLDIADGEMLVLLGPSGCGKTTTMRSIVGLQKPAAGTITIGDEVVFDARRGINVPANDRNIGMVFQSYAIWPHLTVAQNVAFPLRMQKVPKAEIRERVAEVLASVGLQDFGPRGASRLSGGQMQRVALARSLAMRPRMLLLDEPLSNLDAKLRERLRYELRELQQSLGMTAIYVTHDQSEALALADRIAVMRDGVIEQLAGPVDMYRNPRTSFVADFLGVDNIFAARVTGHRGPDGSHGSVARLDGSAIDITAAAVKEVGSPAYVCIRPEDVVLTPSSPRRPEDALAATVVSASFLGDRTRYHLAVEDGPSLFAVAPGAEDPLAPGAKVFTRVPPNKVQLLDD